MFLNANYIIFASGVNLAKTRDSGLSMLLYKVSSKLVRVHFVFI